MKSCCEFHDKKTGCRQGRDCPESNLYAPLRDEPVPTPEVAMTWPYALLLLVLLSVAIGSVIAFLIENWPAIRAFAS